MVLRDITPGTDSEIPYFVKVLYRSRKFARYSTIVREIGITDYY